MWIGPRALAYAAALLLVLLAPSPLRGAPHAVTFSAAPAVTEAYDFVEVTAAVERPDVANPFTGASLTGSFGPAEGGVRCQVEGFCDADDGGTYRIRFMPSAPGEYRYSVAFREGSYVAAASGTFRATDGHRKGVLRVDPAYPWHFIWEGTGEHYFFNGTTAYFLFNWKNERIIRYSIDRLHRLKVNRLRVTIAGRENIFFGEPVMNGGDFSTYPTPWPAENAEDMFHPGFDYSRFYLEYWRRIEHALRFARDRDMTVSLVLDMNDNRVHPAAGSEDERRYIRYAVDRLGAFSNITWDLGDDMERYRDDAWVHATGTWLEQIDPYRHLATSHPVDVVHQDRTSPWFGFTSFQEWSRSQHAFILRERALQEKTGRIIPQTNEEYGYEDHYPLWAPGPGSESADVLRRTAWDIYMAGGYQTAGESARRGTNILPDTGGGWLNGRGDDTQTMFMGFGHIVEFFTSFEWWRTNPHDELASAGAYCLAEPGEIYAAYLPKGGAVTLRLGAGTYAARWFGASTGEWIPLSAASGPSWTSPESPDSHDWALLLVRQKEGS
jgi:hypothetical protein